ncbi:MAG: M42 family metallopeptidase [Oscillospiraceae bacterium]|jgi:endoglucanase|nr:M42 family metallopeptidase [Oscillospiraceae bacterium]
MVKTLKSLCALSGVSGNEEPVSEYIRNRAKNHTDDIVVDVMGNVIIGKKGTKTPTQKIVLCAHMDEVGIVITQIDKEGYLRFAKVGGFDNRVLPGKALLIGKNRVQGIIGCKAIHLVKTKDKEKPMELDEMYIDIGAKDREEAEKLVSLGDTGVFDEDFFEFGDGYIKARAIDDRFGCAVLLELIESELPIDCTFAFTVQEEVGLRGAYTAAYRTAPDITIIVEGTSGADLPSVPENKKVCKVGGGAVLPFMDNGMIYNKEIREMLTNLADKNNIPWQTKTYIAGATDGAVFQRTRSGTKVAGIAAPIRNLHSPTCVGKLSDMEAVFELVRLFLAKL